MSLLLNNKNGFQSKVWGPCAWLFLHCVSFNYSPERKQGYLQFFKNLEHVLPCKSCRINYRKIIKKGPLKLTKKVFDSRFSLSFWLFKVHNKISRDLDQFHYRNTIRDFNKLYLKYHKLRANCEVLHGCKGKYYGHIKIRSLKHFKTSISFI